MRNLIRGATMAAALLAVPVAAESLQEAAGRFGIRETVLSVSLSPSGEKIAFISAGPEHSEILNVVDLAGDGQVRTVTTNTEQNGDLTRCDWASDTRLVCQLFGIGKRGDGLLLGFTRMFERTRWKEWRNAHTAGQHPRIQVQPGWRFSRCARG